MKPPLPAGAAAASLTSDELIAIYIDFRPKLERVIARRVGSRILAADLAQEMFFRIGAMRSELKTRTDAEQYFLRVAVNASLDHLKIEQRRQEILNTTESLFQGPEPSPEASLIDRDEIRRMEDALTELPAKCRTVFLMSRIDGFSHAEIAGRLGVSRSLVEKLIFRALVHCRRRLADIPLRKD